MKLALSTIWANRFGRRVFHAVVVLYLSLMAATFLATNGWTPTWTGGFSSGAWGGPAFQQEQFNQNNYHFGILNTSAPSGYWNDICSGGINQYFGPGASYIHQADGQVMAFYVLASYYDAVNASVGFCNPSPTPNSAYDWGVQQGAYAINTLAGARFLGLTGTVSPVIADAELFEPGTTQCASDASRNANTYQDSSGWLCDSYANNRAVIAGFTDRIEKGCSTNCIPGLNDTCPFCSAVYSVWSHWADIVGPAGASDVGTSAVWIARYTDSQSALEDDLARFAYSGFSFISWQYSDRATNPCHTSYSNARSMLETAYQHNSALYVGRFDKYTGTDPSWICN